MHIEDEYLHLIFGDDVVYLSSDAQSTNADKSVVAEEAVKVETEESPVAEVKEEAAAYEKPPRAIVLIHEILKVEHKTLLEKILGAINISMDDVQLIQSHPEKFTSLSGTQLFLSFHPNYAPKGEYEINIINNIKVIYAHALAELDQNITYKKQLWGNLKKLA
ncbi:hypothetical protein GCM10027429_12400 [Marivirga atlantica]|uniref:DNA polymerase III subunit psi n=1 Tax=Marivirga atlantica TaxID=1548457 RepID=A0A937DGJ7_9BACT|nr:DNA polymerase III subunit psi [Marivirga atlantica]MBL0764853.1 DNA polymerase III subunit psi [Marivirga atlantica]